MSNSIIKLCLLFFIFQGSGCKSTEFRSPEKCVERVLGVKVAKISERGDRYFIVSKEVSAEDIKTNMEKLVQCYSNTKWEKKWSLSLFEEERFAGFKDEKHIIPFHKDGSWKKAYKAEYDRESNTLTAYPLYKTRRIPLD